MMKPSSFPHFTSFSLPDSIISTQACRLVVGLRLTSRIDRTRISLLVSALPVFRK
uniref:Uncharacterized protein n=1 Tax=Arundo donax TaxID=35708 RepID=A0A0A9H7I0_ARUDO